MRDLAITPGASAGADPFTQWLGGADLQRPNDCAVRQSDATVAALRRLYLEADCPREAASRKTNRPVGHIERQSQRTPTC